MARRRHGTVQLTTLSDEARLAVANIADRASGVLTPTVRLGVTGLARAGKTVFIATLVHNLIHGGRLPLLRAYASGRISGANLAPQPDDDVPRFDYERHIGDLAERRIWPDSTHQISELRLTIAFESASYLSRTFGSGRLNVDIVDYPGEWLLDLPLMTRDYATWSHEALARAAEALHAGHAQAWFKRLADMDPDAAENETAARELADLFTAYLAVCRADESALSTQPPGRFLMPGDLEGSPALTFSPLRLSQTAIQPGSMAAMMARRYEAYKKAVVRPFFRDHFARLDRQIVLVDVLAALNAGPSAIADLEVALAEILGSFRVGRTNWLTGLVTRRIDRILFAATKADHLHHRDHDRLQSILARLVARARTRAQFAGTEVQSLALASVRATREASVTQGGETLPTIVGTPLQGETLDGRRFDGKTEFALFPGDLPEDPESVFCQNSPSTTVRFAQFRPPPLLKTAEGLSLSLPHIRLDRALEFLLGDCLS
ncbi:MAG: YcjX family protein [Alphaproteobacteria bacterium]